MKKIIIAGVEVNLDYEKEFEEYLNKVEKIEGNKGLDEKTQKNYLIALKKFCKEALETNGLATENFNIYEIDNVEALESLRKELHKSKFEDLMRKCNQAPRARAALRYYIDFLNRKVINRISKSFNL